MQKNILILTGSPRKGGNTDLMADAFKVGAERAGHTISRFSTGEKTINGCKVCDQCFTKGTACVFSDGFNDLAPMLEKADIVVFATPLYWFTMSAQLKAAIDKFYSFMVAKKPFKKECILLACGEDSNENGFDALVKTYDLMVDYLQWTDLGKLIVTNVFDKGAIKQTDGLAKAEKLGESIGK
ncbi:MAG: flavodoxin family protein [Thermoguttaceae bacterium]